MRPSPVYIVEQPNPLWEVAAKLFGLMLAAGLAVKAVIFAAKVALFVGLPIYAVILLLRWMGTPAAA